MKKYLLSFFAILFIFKLFGQTSGATFVHQVTFKNGCKIQTYPFDDVHETEIGITKIYNSSNQEIFTIPRYFDIEKNNNEFFLNSDCSKLTYIQSTEFSWDNKMYKPIQIYSNEGLVKEFSMESLINCNPEENTCYLPFYNAPIDSVFWQNGKKNILYKGNATQLEIKASKNPYYYKNDLAYLFLSNNSAIELNLSTSDTIRKKIEDLPENYIDNLDTLNLNSIQITQYGNFKTYKGKELKDELAKKLDMKVYNGENFAKAHYLEFDLLVNKEGKGKVFNIYNPDNLPENIIIEFLEHATYDLTYFPNLTDAWVNKYTMNFRNKDLKIAKDEYKIEQKERLVADSIRGVYIPKNLEDSFLTLNKILHPLDIETIKNLDSPYDTIDYHFSLGMWIRNNWGLWGGSRFQKYLEKRGIQHPDDMSSAILKYYQEWLNGENDNWQKFHKKSN